MLDKITQVGSGVQLKIEQHNREKERGGEKGRAGRRGACEKTGIGGGEVIIEQFGLAETSGEGQEQEGQTLSF